MIAATPKDEGVRTLLRKLDIKRDPDAEEAYVVTVELENGATLTADEAEQAVAGASRVLESLEGDEAGVKGNLVRKGDGQLVMLNLGYVDDTDTRVELLVGVGRVVHTKLKYSSMQPYELFQRVRFLSVGADIVDGIGPLFRRMNLELDVQVQPLQAELFGGEQQVAAK